MISLALRHLAAILIATGVLSLASACRRSGKASIEATGASDAVLTSIAFEALPASAALDSTLNVSVRAQYEGEAETRDVSTDLSLRVEADGACRVGRDESSAVHVVTASAIGACSIVATFGEQTASSVVEVVDQATAIKIQVEKTTLPLGTSADIKVVATMVSGATSDVTAAVTWTTAAGGVEVVPGDIVATVRGKVRGVDTLVATYQELTSKLKFKVQDPAITGLKVLTPAAAAVNGVAYGFRALATFSDASTADVTEASSWSLEPANAGTVKTSGTKRGRATFAGSGSVAIKAAYRGLTASAGTLLLGSNISSLGISVAPETLATGYLSKARAYANFSDGLSLDVTGSVTWTSSDESVAKFEGMGSPGEVLGVAPGTATLQATLGPLSASKALTVSNATLADVEISPAAAQVHRGQTLQLLAHGIFSDASTLDVGTSATWSSSVPSVATVGQSASTLGKVEALAGGTTSVSALVDGHTAASQITVVAPNLVRIEFVNPPTYLPAGYAGKVGVRAVYSDASTVDLTSTATMSSSDPSVAAFDPAQDGRLVGHAAGKLKVRAEYEGFHIEQEIDVTASTLESISLVPANMNLAKGANGRFVAQGRFSDGTTLDLSSAVIWVSGDTTVAEVRTGDTTAAGQVDAIDDGTTTVTAKFYLLSAPSDPLLATSNVTVAGTELASLVVLPALVELAPAAAQQLTVTATYSDGSTADVSAMASWSTLDPSVATVSSTGLLTAVADGQTKVHAALSGVDTNSVTVVVQTPVVPLAPTGVAAVANSMVPATAIDLSWNDMDDDTGGYKIAYQVGGTAPASCNAGTTTTAAANTTAKTISGLTAGAQYTFVICTVNAVTGQSALSAGVTASTASPLTTYSGTTFAEAAANDGTITTTRTITLANDTFTSGVFNNTDEYTVTGIPAGLTLVVTRDSSTQLTLSFTGNASSHADANDTSGISLTLNAAAFVSATASSSNNPQSLSLDFNSSASQIETYTSGSGTFTVPSGVTSITIEVWGGGGGGGGGDAGSGNNGGGGGGGGGYTVKNDLSVTPGQTFTYTVGDGGAGAVGDSGTYGVAGGTSNVGGTYIANGGGGGGPGNDGPGGAGGTASGGDVNIQGSTGITATSNIGGAGGAGAHGGTGGAGGSSSVAGSPGTAIGGGGGGGGKLESGGAGANGQVRFSW